MASFNRQDNENPKGLPGTPAVRSPRTKPLALTPEFIEECRRQSVLAAEADALDPSIESFTEAACLETFREIEEMENEALRQKTKPEGIA